MDRTGVGTAAEFSTKFLVDLSTGILPQLTIRSGVSPRVAFKELMWMLRGQTDVSILQEDDIHIWDGNTTAEALASYGKSHITPNTIGKGYSYQFRNFNGVDQLKNVVEGIKKNPSSRRWVINLWTPVDLNDMALEPCHYCYVFQYIDGKLHLEQHLRSNDLVLGAPTNILFASFFLILVAAYAKLPVGYVSSNATNLHIYCNHEEAARMMYDEYMFADILPEPKFTFNKNLETFEDFLSVEYSDFTIDKVKSRLKIPKSLLLMAA
jgi:dihydrofolate reductase/thymidylate synthase